MVRLFVFIIYRYLCLVVLEEVDEGEVVGRHGAEVGVLLLEGLEQIHRLVPRLGTQVVQRPGHTNKRRTVVNGRCGEMVNKTTTQDIRQCLAASVSTIDLLSYHSAVGVWWGVPV